jgi:hypothetical protein
MSPSTIPIFTAPLLDLVAEGVSATLSAVQDLHPSREHTLDPICEYLTDPEGVAPSD